MSSSGDLVAGILIYSMFFIMIAVSILSLILSCLNLSKTHSAYYLKNYKKKRKHSIILVVFNISTITIFFLAINFLNVFLSENSQVNSIIVIFILMFFLLLISLLLLFIFTLVNIFKLSPKSIRIFDKNMLNFEKYLVDQNITSSRRVWYKNVSTFIVDETNQNVIYMNYYSNSFDILPWQKVRQAQILENGNIIYNSGLKGALIGGAIAGVPGALIGSMSANLSHVISNIKIRIIVDDVLNPMRFLDIIKTQTIKGSKDYNDAIYYSNYVYSQLYAIISKTEDLKTSAIINALSPEKSQTSDKLIEYGKMLNQGLLNKAEFDLLKEKILTE